MSVRNRGQVAWCGVLGIVIALGLGCSHGPAPAAQEPQPGVTEGAAGQIVEGAEQTAEAPAEHASAGATEPGPTEASAPSEDTARPEHAEHASAPAPTPPATPEAPAADSKPTTPNGRTADELVTEAEEAAKNGQYGRARRLCEQALRLEPNHRQAVRVCAISACRLNNARLAQRYYAMTTEDDRGPIRQVCKIQGIELEP